MLKAGRQERDGTVDGGLVFITGGHFLKRARRAGGRGRDFRSVGHRGDGSHASITSFTTDVAELIRDQLQRLERRVSELLLGPVIGLLGRQL